MATLLSFVRPQPHGWSNEEKAQFARIQKLLGDAGVVAEVEHGLTDEGEPWCVLCSGTTGDVIIHVARIDGHYLFDSSALPCTIKGRSLDDCAKRFIDDATVLAPRAQHGSKILLHPSAMLAGVMLTIFLYLETVGESAAYNKALIELDAELEAGAIAEDHDLSEEEAKLEAATTRAETVDETDDEQSPLLLLKQMLQQIADAKLESDRTGAQNTHVAQPWISLLPTAAVAAAIAFAQDSTASFATDDEITVLTAEIEAEGEESVPLPEIAEDTLNDAEAKTVIDGTDEATHTEIDVVEAAILDFLHAETPDVTFKDYHDAVEAQADTIVAAEEAVIVEDSFVFAQEETQAAEEETTEAPIQITQFTDDVSSVSRLVRLMSDSSIEIKNEVFALSDFIEIFDAATDRDTDDLNVISSIDLTSPESDTLAFKPYEPKFELASSQEIANKIGAFVKITGIIRFDTTDKDNQVVYDKSVIGLEDNDNVVSHSFSLRDDSVFTFVGFNDELDLLFA